MSGSVDVRAVLDDAIPVYGSKFTHADFDATRAAVAELIDACWPAVTDEGMDQDEINRLRDAFARVGGAK